MDFDPDVWEEVERMILDVIVLDNHYFAKTKSDGRYFIADVPPGEYTLRAWHIFGGEQERKISVISGNKVLEGIDFRLLSTTLARTLDYR